MHDDLPGPDAADPPRRTARRAARQRARARQLMRLRRVTLLAIGLIAVAGLATWFFDLVPVRTEAQGSPSASSVAAPSPRPAAASTAARPPSAVASGKPVPAPAGPVPIPAADAQGRGTFRALTPAALPAPAPAASGARRISYTVMVEDGMRVDEAHAARLIAATLADPRGWRVKDSVVFVPVQAAQAATADLKIMLASPKTTDTLCAPLQTHGEYSCQPPRTDKAIINLRRWGLGAAGFERQIEVYRAMVLNHEIGHFLGHDHVQCPAPGRPAPVMQQQSISLQGCRPNPWPTVA